MFKHALVRDAAYESLLRKRRQDLHARIASAIELRFPQIIEAQPELVARHFGEAGFKEKAIGYWLQAGRLAAARSANVEAIAHLRAGLASINDLPGSSRLRWELSLQLALGGPLIATKGFASSEVETAYLRARYLSRELGHDTDLFTALRGLGYVHHVRGDLRQSMREFPEATDLARRIGEPALIVQAYHFAGVSTFHLGAFQTARDWLQRSLEAGGSHRHYHSEVYGINMGVFCHAYIGHCDWHLGYPDCALNSAEHALLVGRQVSHPFSIALALAYLAMLHQFRREPEAALKAAEEARSLCQEYRFDYYRARAGLGDRRARPTRRLNESGTRLTIIGRRDRLPRGLSDAIAAAERATAANTRLSLQIALDYSARDAIANAAAQWRAEHPPSREAFGRLLAPPECKAGGDVDLLVRSGGEKRLSDFLLWESAYAELHFVETLWPDFGTEHLRAAIADFRSRERRFGGLPSSPALVAAE